MRNNLMVLLLVFAVVGIFIATKHYDNRERNLAEVFAPYADQYKWWYLGWMGMGNGTRKRRNRWKSYKISLGNIK